MKKKNTVTKKGVAEKEGNKSISQWFVYILRCADDTLYTGITTDVERRVREHNGELKGKGAKCTRARRPVQLIYTELCADRSDAGKREWGIKQLSKNQKEKLIKIARH